MPMDSHGCQPHDTRVGSAWQMIPGALLALGILAVLIAAVRFL